jgi:hypothetical protein
VSDGNDLRSFDDDLIRAVRWQDKNAVLREIGAPANNDHQFVFCHISILRMSDARPFAA